MERRYLVATLAIIATFALFSRGLRSIEQRSLTLGQHVGADLRAKCDSDTSAASRFMGKVRTHLRPGYPEEAQLLAEMNLPIAMAQAKAAEGIMRQNMAAAQCARATALREAERAQRQATRMRDKMVHARVYASELPIAWEMNSALDERVREKTAEMAQRMVTRTVSLPIAVDLMRQVSVQISDSDLADTEQGNNSRNSKVRCKVSQTR